MFLLVGIFSAAWYQHGHRAVIIADALWDNAPENGIQDFIAITFERVTINRFIGWYVRKIAPVISACPEHICMYNSFDFTRMLQQPVNQAMSLR